MTDKEIKDLKEMVQPFRDDEEDVEFQEFITDLFGQDNPMKGSSYLVQFGPFPFSNPGEEHIFLVAPKHFFETNQYCADDGDYFFGMFCNSIGLDVESITDWTFESSSTLDEVKEKLRDAGVIETDFETPE